MGASWVTDKQVTLATLNAVLFEKNVEILLRHRLFVQQKAYVALGLVIITNI